MTQENSYSLRNALFTKKLTVGIVVGILFGCLAYVFVVESLIDEKRDRIVIEEPRANDDHTVIDANSINQSSFEDIFQEDDRSINFHELNNELAKLSIEHILAAIDQAASIDSNYQTNIVQEQLFGELAQVAPSRAYKKIWEFPHSRWSDLLPIVMGEWAVVNLTEALRTANSLTGSFQNVSIQTILGELDNESVATIAESLGMESTVERYIQENKAIALLDQPQKAWDLVVDDNVSNTHQKKLLGRIANAWKEQSGFEVLDYLYDELYYLDFALAIELLESIISHAPHDAFEYVVGMPIEKQKIIMPRVLRKWAQTDPEAALEAYLLALQ